MSTSQRAVTPYGWGVKAGTVRLWVAGKLGDRLVTHGPYMSALKIKGYKNSSVYFLLFCYVTGKDNIITISYLVYVSCSCSCIHFFTCKSADSVSLCMFLVIRSNLITRKCCELNTALILLTLIFLNR